MWNSMIEDSFILSLIIQTLHKAEPKKHRGDSSSLRHNQWRSYSQAHPADGDVEAIVVVYVIVSVRQLVK